jgi:hypothetical protein
MFYGIVYGDDLREIFSSNSIFSASSDGQFSNNNDTVFKPKECYLFTSAEQAEDFILEYNTSGKRNLFRNKAIKKEEVKVADPVSKDHLLDTTKQACLPDTRDLRIKELEEKIEQLEDELNAYKWIGCEEDDG